MRHETENSEDAMDRRRLLQALGWAAAAVAAGPGAFRVLAASQARTTAAGARVFPVTTVNHLAINVADYARSRDFYVDLFGMRVQWDNGKQCAVEFGSLTSPNALYIGAARPGAAPGVGHMAFGIPDFWAQRAAIKAELDRRGVKAVADGEAGWTFDDPARSMAPGMQIVPEKDNAMYPGAGGPCVVAASEKCKAGWQAGRKNLDAIAGPSGRGFRATAFSRIVLYVPNLARERDFLRNLWGMKVVDEKPDAQGAHCLLQFGLNTLDLRLAGKAGEKPHRNEYGFVIEDFDRKKVEAELERRGLHPEPDPRWALALKDPDGLRIGIAEKI